jgi:hypothetical protein
MAPSVCMVRGIHPRVKRSLHIAVRNPRRGEKPSILSWVEWKLWRISETVSLWLIKHMGE